MAPIFPFELHLLVGTRLVKVTRTSCSSSNTSEFCKNSSLQVLALHLPCLRTHDQKFPRPLRLPLRFLRTAEHWSYLGLLPAHSTLLNLRRSHQSQDHRHLSSVFFHNAFLFTIGFTLAQHPSRTPSLYAFSKASSSSKANYPSVFVLSLGFNGLSNANSRSCSSSHRRR